MESISSPDSVGKSSSAIVIYDSRFGNTKLVSEALARGLGESGIKTDCSDARVADPEVLVNYDLICIGAPTEEFTASLAIRNFLQELEKRPDFHDKFGFAFDTKVSPGVFGSAARLIEKDLKRKLKMQILAPHQTATVDSIRMSGAIVGAELREGEEKKFESIGRSLGSMLEDSTLSREPILV